MNKPGFVLDVDHSNKNYKILKTIIIGGDNDELYEITANNMNKYTKILELDIY